MGVPLSQTLYGEYGPFNLQVARGQIVGHSVLNLFGYQSAVGTGTPLPVWENFTAYTYPVAATTMLVYSTSASDTNVNITIFGLDASWNIQTEIITLTNGTTGVTTTKSFLRINSAICNDAAYALPVGSIIIGNAAKTVTYAKILPTINRTQMAIYTVPAGYTFYLERISMFTGESGSGTNFTNYQVYTKQNITGQTFVVLQAPVLGVYNIQRVYPFPYVEKTDIQWQASAGSGSTPVGINVEGVLIKNEIT